MTDDTENTSLDLKHVDQIANERAREYIFQVYEDTLEYLVENAKTRFHRCEATTDDVIRAVNWIEGAGYRGERDEDGESLIRFYAGKDYFDSLQANLDRVVRLNGAYDADTIDVISVARFNVELVPFLPDDVLLAFHVESVVPTFSPIHDDRLLDVTAWDAVVATHLTPEDEAVIET